MTIEWNDPAEALALLGRHIGLWRWELESGSLQWSDHYLAILGCPRQEFTGHISFFEERLHEEDNKPLRRAAAKHLETGEPFQLRCRLRHNDGSYRTVLTQGTSKPTKVGGATILMGTVLDVTIQATAIEALAESEQTFRSMADNVPGALIRYIRPPEGTDAIDYLSAGCEKIWELTAEDIRRDPALIWRQVFDDDIAAMQRSVLESGENLTYWEHRWRIRTPSGQVKHLEGRGNPRKMADGRVVWNSLIMDISDSEELRDELLRQQEMLGQAQKMESIGRIAGGIAHDFNNLLAIIMGNAELCSTCRDTDELETLIVDIIEACRRGSSLTGGLLSFARQSHLDPSVLDVNAVVLRTAQLVARVIPETISVETVRQEDVWPVEADDTHLQSALLNLCINARDAMEESGGMLTIETANVSIESTGIGEHWEDIPPGRYVMIAVSDTGHGIAEADLQHIVEPFYTTKSLEQGSGLGLAMVDGFARQSRGALRIYSEPKHGTSIKIYLPTCDAAAAREVAPDESGGTAAVPTPAVLIVEDEEAIRSVLERSLARSGFEVRTAASGDEAFEAFADGVRDFDILLTDVVMPGALQGPALAAALTQLNPALCVVFMSGYPHEAAVRGNGLRPTDRFLMKPVGHRELVQALHDVLEQRESSDGA